MKAMLFVLFHGLVVTRVHEVFPPRIHKRRGQDGVFRRVLQGRVPRVVMVDERVIVAPVECNQKAIPCEEQSKEIAEGNRASM